MSVQGAKIKKVNIGKLQIHEKTVRSREFYDQAYLDELIKAYKLGGEGVPFVSVFFDGSGYILSDGFYRIEAAKRAGIKTIFAKVKNGKTKEAVMHSCKANNSKAHPEVLKRTNKCKKKTIQIWMKYVDRRIASHQLAELIGISSPNITKIRHTLQNGERKSRGNRILTKKTERNKRKKSFLPPEVKIAFGNLRTEIKFKNERQWNVAVKEEVLSRLSVLYRWVESDLQGE